MKRQILVLGGTAGMRRRFLQRDFPYTSEIRAGADTVFLRRRRSGSFPLYGAIYAVDAGVRESDIRRAVYDADMGA